MAQCGQSSLVTWTQSSAPLGICERAVQPGDKESFILRSHDRSPDLDSIRSYAATHSTHSGSAMSMTSHVQVVQCNSTHSIDQSFSSSAIPTTLCGDKLLYPATILVSEFESLGINKASRVFGLLAVQQVRSKVYTITNIVEFNRMIAALVIRSNSALAIMTREGNVLSLIDASAKTFFLTSTIPNTFQTVSTAKPSCPLAVGQGGIRSFL